MNETEKHAEPAPAPDTIAQRRAVDGVRRPRRAKRYLETPLTESLDELKAEDLKIQPKKKKNRRGFSVTQWILLGLCLAVFLFSGFKVAGNLFEYAEGQKQYDELKEIFYSSLSSGDYLAEPLPAAATPDLLTAMQADEGDPNAELFRFGENENYQVVLARLSKLRALNSDTYGWIKVSGTDVDYPVVQGDNNDYYLRRSFYKSALNSGSIFADAACAKPMENRNTVIYGHNMKDGTMFHSLHNLDNQTYFDSAEIRLMTTEGIYVYEVYSVHEPHETDRFFFTEFSEASWQEFLNWTVSDSKFVKAGVQLSPDDHIITLATCISTTEKDTHRFVVHGVLRNIITA